MTTEKQKFDETDPYAIDHERIKEEAEQKRSGGGNKTKWHSVPADDGLSNWRILPFPKRRTWFVKVSKHWHVPGLKGSLTCPRSFDDPSNPTKKYPCAICEKFFELYNSKEAGDRELAKQTLKQSTSYYTNAINMDKPEDGVGVFNMPYNVWKTLFDWLDVASFREFSHPVRGRDIIIKSSKVAGTQVPGQTNKEKRDYSVIPGELSPITNPEWLQQLYDLDAVVGIPTFQFTQACLERLMSGDANAGQLPEGTTLYHKRLGSGDVPSGPDVTASVAPPTVITNSVPTQQPPTTFTAPTQSTPAPTFAAAATESVIQPKTAPVKQSQADIKAMMRDVLQGKKPGA